MSSIKLVFRSEQDCVWSRVLSSRCVSCLVFSSSSLETSNVNEINPPNPAELSTLKFIHSFLQKFVYRYDTVSIRCLFLLVFVVACAPWKSDHPHRIVDPSADSLPGHIGEPDRGPLPTKTRPNLRTFRRRFHRINGASDALQRTTGYSRHLDVYHIRLRTDCSFWH